MALSLNSQPVDPNLMVFLGELRAQIKKAMGSLFEQEKMAMNLKGGLGSTASQISSRAFRKSLHHQWDALAQLLGDAQTVSQDVQRLCGDKERLEKARFCALLYFVSASVKEMRDKTRLLSTGLPPLETPYDASYTETVKVPQMAESITEGTLKQWTKQVGDTVEQDEEVATIETDKIDVSVNAPKAGKIVELLAKEEDTVTVGQDLFKIEPGEGGGASSAPAAKEEPVAPPPKKDEPTPPSDKKEDAKAAEPTTPPPPKPEPKEAPTPAPKPKDEKVPPPKPKEDKPSAPAAAPPVPGSRNETRVKMNRMRLRIAERLKESQNTAASLTTFNEIDMSSLMEMRKLYKDEVLKKHDVKLGFMSAFAKAACLALKEIPVANAAIEGDSIVYRDYVDLSVAVATPKGS
ncbi:Dihydrolipoyllysine-residue succinyltransferase component of 2-oxoglutarate dehydrogenase complex, mitochondrial; AltName: Full=2-oxoglutarate dehydrogenase complex component E2; Short=OGDC-E2; AltName: Full=Dihydrolipoamide succinyltransferase component of 2-oxoglutarate dehydrogenase complex; Flags: Precursor [Serendipita indica DSM 11827]|nr:Dihydrolipoyllysine-residue succinyltransferase component of 2-oxoglutarate dehydrogenase complex, mitochondrial; AltName: Full=2-oxoglutarate dehydrogenase complex component E2; Short=OGDC-E2; AltName: Full=Dihydrolipoamide succinyltransferase component of 2-oxoglutarate dehydrogenase complex; Flags: Precursor [Serendipita indica DSM 11827]